MGDWKTRLSTLWLISVISGVSVVMLGVMESGDLNVIGGMSVDTSFLYLFMVLILGQLVMAFLSQTLADKANCWINIIVGAVYIIPPLYAFISAASDASVFAINPLFGILWSVLIVWHAWKWPKQEA